MTFYRLRTRHIDADYEEGRLDLLEVLNALGRQPHGLLKAWVGRLRDQCDAALPVAHALQGVLDGAGHAAFTHDHLAVLRVAMQVDEADADSEAARRRSQVHRGAAHLKGVLLKSPVLS